MNSSIIKQQVLAIMHGDCYVDVNEHSGKARLDIYHKESNYDLLLKKKHILEQVTGVTVRVTKKADSRLLKSGKCREGYRLQTNFSRYFFKLHVAPFKYVVKQLVKPLALAIMWQDDGTICWHSRNGKKSFSTATLATDDWSLERVTALRNAWNTQYGWCPVVMDYICREKSYLRLRLQKEYTEKLSDVISDHVVDSLKYKLITFKTLKANAL